MSDPTFFQVLGLYNDADDEAVKQAYRALARDHHPDAGGDVWKFAAINRAYEALEHAVDRHRYLQELRLRFPACVSCEGRGFTQKQLTFTTTERLQCPVCLAAGVTLPDG